MPNDINVTNTSNKKPEENSSSKQDLLTNLERSPDGGHIYTDDYGNVIKTGPSGGIQVKILS